MRGKRTDTYYVYDAYTDELVGCGSLAKISELFDITPRTLIKYAENGSLYASRNTDNLLKFKRIDGIIEDVEPTIKLASGKIKRSTYLSKFGEDTGINKMLKDILKEMNERCLK